MERLRTPFDGVGATNHARLLIKGGRFSYRTEKWGQCSNSYTAACTSHRAYRAEIDENLRVAVGGSIPMRVKITAHGVGWIEHEVQAWLAGRIAKNNPLRTYGQPSQPYAVGMRVRFYSSFTNSRSGLVHALPRSFSNKQRRLTAVGGHLEAVQGFDVRTQQTKRQRRRPSSEVRAK